jgi:mannose-6-phosphate isomerase-like protein (cupin superfamily)
MLMDTEYTILSRDALPRDGHTHEFEGTHYDGVDVSFIWVDMPPGRGVRLHKHPYKEIFVIQDGPAMLTAGAEAIEARAGQIIIVPAQVPHKFANTGNEPLRQVDIHVSSQFITHWLEDGEP